MSDSIFGNISIDFPSDGYGHWVVLSLAVGHDGKVARLARYLNGQRVEDNE